MELLTRTFRTCRRVLSPNGWFSVAVALALLALEAAGRQLAATDIHDLIAASALALIVTWVGYRHRSQPLPWVARLISVGKRIYAWLYRWTFEFGLDLRGRPPIKRGYPPAVLIVASVLVAWTIVLMVVGADLPAVIRGLSVRYLSYVGYLVFITALWAVLIAAILLSLLLPIAMIHDNFVQSWPGPGRRRRQPEMYAVLGFLAALLAAGLLLPIWVLLAMCLGALLLNLTTMMLPANSEMQFLWRPRGSLQVRAIPWTHWIGCEFSLITLLLLNLVVTGYGATAMVIASENSPMQFTSFLGTLLAWLAPGLLGALVAQSILGRWRDPARQSPPRAAFVGAVAPELQKRIRGLFAARGWRVDFAASKSDHLAVPLQLVPPVDSDAREFDPAWPLKISEIDVQDAAVFERLTRRYVIQTRRRVIAGLKTMFKRAAERKYRNGLGFWVAPQYWFITGISRDQHEDEMELSDSTVLSSTIGPGYHRVLSQPVRNHMFEILRALEIDLIFVEDGVTIRRFTRVMRRIFEVYDKSGGQKRAEDTHFVGMPGIRVLFHEFQLDDPFKSKVYPEPKYDNLGRARILHIFRDRSEQEELVEPPFDFGRTPSPVATR